MSEKSELSYEYVEFEDKELKEKFRIKPDLHECMETKCKLMMSKL